jgi:hypothetical protein
MRFGIPQIDYEAISTKVRLVTKVAALHPYLRLFVLITTFISLFSAVVIKDDNLPLISSSEDSPSGARAWEDLRFITQQPHPWNSRQNDVVREYILSEMNEGTDMLC